MYQQKPKSMDILGLDVNALEGLFHGDRENSLSNLLRSIGDHLRNRIKDLREYISHAPDDSTQLTRDLEEVVKNSDKIDYIRVRDQMVAVPEGYAHLSYLVYITELVELVNGTESITERLCAEYKQLVNVIAVNGSDKVLMTDYQKLYSEATAQREHILERMKAFFTDVHIAVAPVKIVLHSLSDIKMIRHSVPILTNGCRPEYLNSVSNKVEGIHASMEVLISNISNHSVVIHGPDITDLGQGAYALAQYLETVGLLYYNSVVLLNRIQDLATLLLSSS
jgi:hypothetical protein